MRHDADIILSAPQFRRFPAAPVVLTDGDLSPETRCGVGRGGERAKGVKTDLELV